MLVEGQDKTNKYIFIIFLLILGGRGVQFSDFLSKKRFLNNLPVYEPSGLPGGWQFHILDSVALLKETRVDSWKS